MNKIVRATTVLAIVDKNGAAIGADGQVSMGETIMKASASKIRRMYNDTVLTGFAGATADAFTLYERFESKIDEFSGNLARASVELAKEWRTDKYLPTAEIVRKSMEIASSICVFTNSNITVETL